MTKATIDLAVFDFTSGELAGALLTAHERRVVVRVVADARQARGKHSEIPLLVVFLDGHERAGVAPVDEFRRSWHRRERE